MTFVEDMYKPKPNPYIQENAIIHNLYIVELVKRAAEKNKNSRCFEGYYYAYNSVPGDGETNTREINPQNYSPIDILTSFGEIDWEVVEKLAYEKVQKADIGFRFFEVKVVEKVYQRKEQNGYTFLGKPKYKRISVPCHCLWVRAKW